MAIEFYGARYIGMGKFNIPDKREIMRLRRKEFVFVCKDNSYIPIKAFKREPILIFSKDRTSYRFEIHPKTDEKEEDIMIPYTDDEIFYFMKVLRSGEMFDINMMVAFDCIHHMKEKSVKEEAEKIEKFFLKCIDNF